MNDHSSIGTVEQSEISTVGRENDHDDRSFKHPVLPALTLCAGVLLTFAWVGVLLYAMVVFLF